MTDDELFDKYRQSHDPALLDELVRRNFDRVYRFVASMIGKRQIVDDLVQDVLLNVIRGIDRFRGESSFATWIYRITVNRIYRYFEEEKKAIPTVETEHLAMIAVPHQNTAETEELKHRIDGAIADLSPPLRAAMLLTSVEGLTPEQAAEVENCTAANIHWRVHKARKTLKEKLREYF